MGNIYGRPMEFLKLYTSFWNHPKVLEVMSYIREHDKDAVRDSLHRDVAGSILSMWIQTALFNPDGHIEGADNYRKLAVICEWHGKAETWAHALAEAKLIHQKDDGFEVHDWHEYTEGWVLLQERVEHERVSTARRSKKYRDKIRAEKQELKALREATKKYDASPPSENSVTQNQRDEAVTPRDERVRDVMERDDTLSEKTEFSPPQKSDENQAENAIIPPNRHAENDSLTTQYDAVTKKDRDERHRHVSSRPVTVQEKRREFKDKDSQDANDASLAGPVLDKPKAEGKKKTVQQQLTDHFKARLEHALGEPTTGRSFRYEWVVSAIFKLLYDKSGAYKFKPDEVRRRIDNWFDSTAEFVPKIHWAFSTFQENFNRLKDGPIHDSKKGDRKPYGELDKRKEQFETHDDFGTNASG